MGNPVLLPVRCPCGQSEKDLRRSDQPLTSDGSFRSVVALSRLFQEVCADDGASASALTVAVCRQCLSERCRGVEAGVKCCRHLHLVDGIKLCIFFHRLPVSLSVAVILMIGKNEFRTGDGYTIHRHHHRIRLCLSGECGEPEYWK